MIDLKHDESYENEEYDYDYAIIQLLDSFDTDSLITLYFYTNMLIGLSNINKK